MAVETTGFRLTAEDAGATANLARVRQQLSSLDDKTQRYIRTMLEQRRRTESLARSLQQTAARDREFVRGVLDAVRAQQHAAQKAQSWSSRLGELTRRLRGAVSGSRNLADAQEQMNQRTNRSETATIAFGTAIGSLVSGGLFRLQQGLMDVSRAALAAETAIAEVTTIANEAEFGSSAITDISRELNRSFGGGVAKQAKALYQAISSGAVTAAEANELLFSANQLAIGGLADLSQTIDGLTSVVNSYRAFNLSAAEASDILFTTVRLGKTTIPELSASIGQVAPLAASMGIEFRELSAAIAALTQKGVSTAEAITQVRSVLVGVAKATPTARRAADKMGVSFDLASLRAKGLKQFLDEIASTGATEEQLFDLFGRIEALNGTLGLTGPNARVFQQAIEGMSDSMGQASQAAEKLQNTLSFQFQKLGANVTDLAVAFGQTFSRAILGANGLQRTLQGVNNYLVILSRFYRGEFTDMIQGVQSEGMQLDLVNPDDIANFERIVSARRRAVMAQDALNSVVREGVQLQEGYRTVLALTAEEEQEMTRKRLESQQAAKAAATAARKDYEKLKTEIRGVSRELSQLAERAQSAVKVAPDFQSGGLDVPALLSQESQQTQQVTLQLEVSKLTAERQIADQRAQVARNLADEQRSIQEKLVSDIGQLQIDLDRVTSRSQQVEIEEKIALTKTRVIEESQLLKQLQANEEARVKEAISVKQQEVQAIVALERNKMQQVMAAAASATPRQPGQPARSQSNGLSNFSSIAPQDGGIEESQDAQTARVTAARMEALRAAAVEAELIARDELNAKKQAIDEELAAIQFLNAERVKMSDEGGRAALATAVAAREAELADLTAHHDVMIAEYERLRAAGVEAKEAERAAVAKANATIKAEEAESIRARVAQAQTAGRLISAVGNATVGAIQGISSAMDDESASSAERSARIAASVIQMAQQIIPALAAVAAAQAASSGAVGATGPAAPAVAAAVIAAMLGLVGGLLSSFHTGGEVVDRRGGGVGARRFRREDLMGSEDPTSGFAKVKVGETIRTAVQEKQLQRSLTKLRTIEKSQRTRNIQDNPGTAKLTQSVLNQVVSSVEAKYFPVTSGSVATDSVANSIGENWYAWDARDVRGAWNIP